MYREPCSILNFNCPVYLKNDIDEICKFRRISRTALINTFFEATVKEWKPRIEHLRQSQNKPPSTEDVWKTRGVRCTPPGFFSSHEPSVIDNDW
jgi:hypothetical protein